MSKPNQSKPDAGYVGACILAVLLVVIAGAIGGGYLQ